MPIENTPRSYRPSRSISRSLAWTWRMCGPNSRMNARDVDHLQDQVRRVEVEPDRAAPLLEDPPPDPRRRREVVAARPLVAAEQHRAVLDGDLAGRGPGRSATMSGQTRRASSQLASWSFEPSAPMNVLTSGDAHRLGGGDDVLEVADDLAAMRRVGVERVRVVAEAGDRRGPSRAISSTISRRLARRQVRDVDVARCRRSGGSGRRCAASRRSRCSRSRSAAVQSTTSSAASRGTARSAGRASSEVRLEARPGRPAARRRPGRRRGRRRPSARASGALGDRVVDEHLVVAVGERRVGRVRATGRRRRRRRRSPGSGRRTCRRSPRHDRPAAPPPRGRPGPSAPGS